MVFAFIQNRKQSTPKGCLSPRGAESHYIGQWGWRGRQKANLTQGGILGEAQLLSLNPSMGRREEQEEVNRSAALKLASFTPITDTVMPCFMLPSQRQPCRASAPVTNVQNGKAKETMGVGNQDA